MKAVLGEDGHRHFFGQQIEGVRNDRLPAERFDGEIQTSLPRHRRRPGPRGVDDLPGGNVAAGGTHRRDPARPLQLETRTLHAVLKPHAKPCGALDVAAPDLHRPDKAVGQKIPPTSPSVRIAGLISSISDGLTSLASLSPAAL